MSADQSIPPKKRRSFTTLDRDDFNPEHLEEPDDGSQNLLISQFEDCLARLKRTYLEEDGHDLIKAINDGYFRVIRDINKGSYVVGDENAARFWLFRQAKRALWTIWQEKKKFPRAVSLELEGLAYVLGESLTDTEIGTLWSTAINEDRTSQIEFDFREFMKRELTAEIRAVAHAIIDNFPHRPTHQQLADHIKEHHNHSMHPKKVERYRDQIRQLFRDFLKK